MISVFQTADTVRFGPGAVEMLPEVVGAFEGTKVAVVSDPGIESAGLADRVRDLLTTAGAHVWTFSEVEHDPSFETLRRARDGARAFGAELVVGVGGGSALDVGKMVAALLGVEGEARDFVGTGLIPHKGRPYVAIPTTAGTGSEVTGIVILSDHQDHLKKGVVSEHLLPDVALVDPTLTHTLPPVPTAASGMDALTHAIEAFTSVKANALTDALALGAVERIVQHLETAYRDGTNAEARAAVMEGALLAGMSFASAGVAAVHAMAYPLGGRFDVPHGMANAMLLPVVMAFNRPAAEARYARLARQVGIDTGAVASDAEAFVDRVDALAHAVGMAKPLRTLGVQPDDLPSMAEEAHAIRRLMDNNPRDATPEDVLDIYQTCYARDAA
ncbi:MAG: iron-containing alcohol dehydrogenase [Bacteroidetes bacterium]|jgi:alcohol dehydrogenase class IV|nr:iron-containing alcohol dehydrogenase [Bacteroidota bacterium]